MPVMEELRGIGEAHQIQAQKEAEVAAENAESSRQRHASRQPAEV